MGAMRHDPPQSSTEETLWRDFSFYFAAVAWLRLAQELLVVYAGFGGTTPTLGYFTFGDPTTEERPSMKSLRGMSAL